MKDNPISIARQELQTAISHRQKIHTKADRAARAASEGEALVQQARDALTAAETAEQQEALRPCREDQDRAGGRWRGCCGHCRDETRAIFTERRKTKSPGRPVRCYCNFAHLGGGKG